MNEIIKGLLFLTLQAEIFLIAVGTNLRNAKMTCGSVLQQNAKTVKYSAQGLS